PLWTILENYGISSGIVRWPLTYPAQPVSGFLVTDRFHQVIGSMFEFDRAAYPADLLPILRESFESNPPADPSASPDALYSRALHDLSTAKPVQLAAVRYTGLDTAGHHDLGGAQFGEGAEAARARPGGALDRYYAYIDSEIGAAVDRLVPGD